MPQPPLNKPVTNNIKEGGNNQKPILFKRGIAISKQPIIIGTNQFNLSLIFQKEFGLYLYP